MSEYAQTAKSIILSFGIGQVLPIDDVRCIVEDYLAAPDERDYIRYTCVACSARHQSKTTNLCAAHRDICLLCRGSTRSKKLLVCRDCALSQDVRWIYALESNEPTRRSLIYFQWYGVRIFPSRFWPKANSATAARRRREAEDIARRATFLIGEMIKPVDQRIAELTSKLYEANRIINNLRKFATHDTIVTPCPEFPFF
jgi:hypothetical protein